MSEISLISINILVHLKKKNKIIFIFQSISSKTKLLTKSYICPLPLFTMRVKIISTYQILRWHLNFLTSKKISGNISSHFKIFLSLFIYISQSLLLRPFRLAEKQPRCFSKHCIGLQVFKI